MPAFMAEPRILDFGLWTLDFRLLIFARVFRLGRATELTFSAALRFLPVPAKQWRSSELQAPGNQRSCIYWAASRQPITAPSWPASLQLIAPTPRSWLAFEMNALVSFSSFIIYCLISQRLKRFVCRLGLSA